jgi:hypothetical protein
MNADHKLACPHVMGGWVAVECVGSVRDGQKDKGPESDLMFKAANLRSPGVER